MGTEVQTPEESVAIILCRRCALNEVSEEGDLCGKCMQELIEEGWRRWFESRWKE